MKRCRRQYLIAALVIIFLIANAVYCCHFSRIMLRASYWSANTPAMQIFFMAGMVVSILAIAYLFLQAVLAFLYRPWALQPDRELPRCTVVVPAYNEGESVCKTLSNLLTIDYPADKLEIIAVNDGSVDDTALWIQRAADASHGRIKFLDMPQNRGKKHAICAATRIAKGDFIVTVDSDSSLEKEALKHLVAPFSDPEIGGSAGTIRVRNLKGVIPRMLDVTFVFGCDFLRCAQSMLGYVLCTPGAISAYRKSAILPLLDKWASQTFLGVPSRIGEDRALTSLLLINGYKVVCQSSAVATTDVPSGYKGLCRMMLRWTRGDIRESMLLCPHVFLHFRADWKYVLFQVNIISQLVGMALPLFYAVTIIILFAANSNVPFFAFYYMLSVNMLWSILPAAIYTVRRNSPILALWAFFYGVFSLIALSWICIYSYLTVRNSNWMTRDKKAKAPLPEKVQ